MHLHETKCLASLVFLGAFFSSSSANIASQTRSYVPVNVDNVTTTEYTETSQTSEIHCAIATKASYIYCYTALRCLKILSSSYGAVRGPMTPGWTCKTGELVVCGRRSIARTCVKLSRLIKLYSKPPNIRR